MRIQGIKSVLLAVSALALSFAVYAETLYSDGAVLGLAEHNGAVEFMRGADGVPRVVAADEAFTLQLLDEKGEPTRLKSSEFAFETGRAARPFAADGRAYPPSEASRASGGYRGASTMPPFAAVSSKPPYQMSHCKGGFEIASIE